MKHLLVTNDFPPKLGGIQTLLWELWRRLDPESFVVHTTPYEGSGSWDAAQPFEVIRSRERVLLPHPQLVRRVDRLAEQVGAELVVLDPALPLGLIGPHLERPYALLLHGAEVTVPGRVPGVNLALRRALLGAERVVAFGGYPGAEAERAAGRSLPISVVPCGIDTGRFQPLAAGDRAATRARFGLGDGPVVLSLSRLVPRKGMDVLIRAADSLVEQVPGLEVAIGGTGRDRGRLGRIADRSNVPVHFLGRVDDADLASVYASADVFAMLCRNRWGGLEQEGFGIVFLEAAAAGVPQVAGRSGGAAEAVLDGETGFVVDDPGHVPAVADALRRLLSDAELRRSMGRVARERAHREFEYDHLARALAGALERR